MLSLRLLLTLLVIVALMAMDTVEADRQLARVLHLMEQVK